MITFDLACDQGHRFEGWFRNREDFDQQREQGLLTCPLCGSTAVEKKLSAVSVHVPRRTAAPVAPVAPRAGDGQQTPAVAADPRTAPAAPAAPAASAGATQGGAGADVRPFFQALTQFVETHFEDVGDRFADEARRLERGEAETRNIRGTTTREEEESLREDGIEFLKIPLPKYDA